MLKLYTAAFLVLFCAEIYSQTVSVGPKLGMLAGSPVPYSFIPEGAKGAPKPGRNVGVFVCFEFSDHYSLTYELALTRKRTTFETPLDSVSYVDRIQHPLFPDVVFEVETFFNGTAIGCFDNYYLEQSLTHQISITEKLNGLIGLYTAWLQKSNTYAKGIGRVGFSPDIIEQELDYSSKMRQWDYGLKAGIGYEASKHMDIDLKLSYGFESVFCDSFSMLNYTVNNTFVELSLNYKFFILRQLNSQI
ncbi:MAG TPA: outer membrane beta-barrel protein [Bacteroidales bacterium]|nr:outer membrane beta-barrel protein [Bacteroidales bacterium]